MTQVTQDVVARAEGFLWLTGRVLEQRRFAFLFGTGDREGVRAALEAYRNADGGFAYGLEPDVRGPVSQPITLTAALPVLDEIGALGETEAERICEWLESVTAADGGVPAVLPSLRDYPHPPWLAAAGSAEGQLLPTGPIAALLMKNKVAHPWVKKATEFCWGAVAGLGATHPYEAEAVVTFLDHAGDRDRASREAERLGRLVRDQRLVLLDPAHPETARVAPGYAPGEYHLAHDFAPRPHSLARAWFSDEEMDLSLHALSAAQQGDGGWPIRWAQWAPTIATEARPGVTVSALLTLRAYGRLEA